MEIQEIKTQFEESLKPLKSRLEGLAEDLKKKPESAEIKTAVDEVLLKMGTMKTEHEDRLKGLEDKLSKSRAFGSAEELKSIGEMVVDSDQYKNFTTRKEKSSGQIEVGSFHKTAIVNATGQNQPLVPAVRVPGIFNILNQRLTMRDILPVIPTNGNSIEFVRETTFTNAAAPQGAGSSPQVYENVAKAESALAFTLYHEPVQTLAHWIPASRQVLDDAVGLQAYINSRLMYGLKLKEESQILTGSGAAAQLNGLVTQATAYDTGLNAGGDTDIDKLRHVMLQAELANSMVSAFVLNPTDWHNIELIKTTGTSSSGEYIFANPHGISAPSIWGVPVVSTQSVASGHFLTGDFNNACALYDRMNATVEVSRDYSDYFVKNMVAILAEERLALVVYRPAALFYGAF